MAFLGIRINQDVGRLLQGIDVPGDTESPSEYHITLLCFEDNWKISNVSKALEATYDVISKIKPFLIKTEKFGCFPKREGKPLPIIARVEGKELHNLRNKLAKKFDEENIEYSKIFKEFKPHITLAYYDTEDEIDDVKFDKVEFSVQDIVLWAGDHGDDRLFITFPLKGPEAQKKSSFLLQKANMFCKIAQNEPQDYLTSTYERRLFERKASENHYIPDMKSVSSFLDRLNGDVDGLKREYKEYGGWTKYTFQFVPINDIEVKEVWQESKIPPVLKRMQEGLVIDPIKLGENATKNSKWSIIDGIHRIAASKMMGYTEVPALVAEWVETPPEK